MLRHGQLHAIHTDHRNAPLAVTDAARQVVWQASVADYLQATPASGSNFGAITFDLRGSNQYFDRESGLHYNTHRYYDPVSTRYLTPDPLGLAVGPDLHAFALNRPQTMADPLGLAPAAATTDWSRASYDDKFVEIVKRTAPMVPGEIGAALLELVQPGNLAAMGAVFGIWAAAQATPAGWVADAAILGLSVYALGTGVIDLYQGLMALHDGAETAKCDPDLTAAARIVANRLVAAAGGIGGGVAGGAAVGKSGGIERIAKGVRDIIGYAKTRGDAGGTKVPVIGNGKINAIAPVEKFSEYIFKEGATHGKDVVFKNLGYDARHSEFLSKIWSDQAAMKFANCEFTLGKLDQFGQRINVGIELPGINQAAGKSSYINSGWMILDDSRIKLNTPFSGFIK